MTANSVVPAGVLYADEASFGDSTVTSFDEALRHIGRLDLSGLTQEKQDRGGSTQLQNEGTQPARMVQGGSFKIVMDLTGHGSAVASGAVTANQLEVFLGRVIGNVNVAAQGTTTSGAGADADTFDVQAGAGANLVADLLIRIGALGDGDGEGQFYPIDSISTDTINLLVEMAGTAADSQVVYAPANIYPNEGPNSTTLTSMRFELLTSNEHVRCWGCFPSAVEFSGLSPTEFPQVTVTMQVAKWLPVNSTFPHAVLVDAFAPAPVAAGSLFLQTFGTTTRQTYAVREFNFGVEFETVPLTGHGSGDAYVGIIGAKRTGCRAFCDVVLETEATGTYTHQDSWNTSEISINPVHLLYSFNVGTDGQCGAIYLRKARIVGARPRPIEVDGLWRQRLHIRAEADTDGTNDQTRCNFIIASA